MAVGNSITVTGNVTRDPELRFTPSGAAVAKFGLAVNRRWQNRTTQEWEEATSFFDVEAWNALAQHVSSSVVRGTRLIVEGRLEQESWGPDDDKKYRVKIVAEDVGASLMFATAEISRVERRQSPASAPPARLAAMAAAGGADEEPF